MRILSAFILCCATAVIFASEVLSTDTPAQERAAIMGELSQRSGLSDAELSSLLANCNANQQSMYFCAWRDQIAASRNFARVLADKLQKMPQCKKTMETKVASWMKSRDQSCEKSATQEWGEGSMKPTAQTICVTAETVRMTTRLEHLNGCEFK
jgi:uncharacterized protein YecT (DUF1311 family)